MTTAPIPPPRSEPAIGPRRIFTATFRPAPCWSRDIQRHAGLRCEWVALWRVGEGAFAGELACVPLHGAGAGLAWAPESELVNRT